MKKTLLVLLLVFTLLLSPVMASGNQSMRRTSDPLSTEERTDISLSTIEALQNQQNGQLEWIDNSQPQPYRIFGWFNNDESSTRVSSNAIITGGETRAILGSPNSGETLETFKIYSKDYDLAFRYSGKLAGENWQEEQCGTYDLAMSAGNVTPESKKLTNLKMCLDGPLSLGYELYYRVYIQGEGWTPWASMNNPVCPENATGNFECLETRILPKGSSAPLDSTDTQNVPLILSSYHQENKGTVDLEVGKTITLGTENSGLRLEAYSLKTDNPEVEINYKSYVTDNGWQDEKHNGELSGTEGLELPIEAVKIKLVGPQAANYDVYYRSYVDGYGWLDWANNDMVSGTINQGLKIESIKIRILPKSGPLPGPAEVPAVIALTREEGTFISAINNLRIQRGLLPLTGDYKLSEAANIRLNELATKYSHIRPDGVGFESVLDTVNYRLDGMMPALGECFSRSNDISKALANFSTRQICKSLLLTDYYRYCSMSIGLGEGAPELVTVLLSDTPSDYSLLY